MAVPFDKFPSLRTYLEWVRKEAGGDYKEGHYGTTRMYKIIGPSGRFAMIAEMPDGEGLTPTMVGNLDRRLGVVSPFPKAPEPYS